MIGHGFSGRVHTESDVDKAHLLCRDIALLIDRKIGLSPDIGEW